MPDVTSTQKGKIGEALFESYSKVSSNSHPLIFKTIVDDILRNHRDVVERCDSFSLRIVSKSETFEDEGEEKELKYGFSKGEPEKDEQGEIKSMENVASWIADAVIVANFSEGNMLMTFRNIEYPIEIKTGNRAELEGEQREAFIHASQTIEGRPLLIRIDIADLPEQFDLDVKKYDPEREQIRKVKESDLITDEEVLDEKYLGY